MNYDVLINTAIEKNEVLQLLRGEKEYEVIVFRIFTRYFSNRYHICVSRVFL